MSAEPYDSPNGLTIADLSPADFAVHETAPGVTAEFDVSTDRAPDGSPCASYTAERAASGGPWAKISRTFSPYADVSGRQALGVWVCGDGQGELLSFQWGNPSYVIRGRGDRFVVADFTGWRYFELIEPEGERIAEYSWPSGAHAYDIYREGVSFAHVDSLSIWYNNLPEGKKVACCLSPVRALPLAKGKLRNPAIKVGDQAITFPVEIESGQYLEFRSLTDCKLYGEKGELLREVRPEGPVPVLEPGDNPIVFECNAVPEAPDPRARVTLISQGEPLK